MVGVTLDRRRVLARRFAAHGLAARDEVPAAVLRLGVQDSPPGSVALALDARSAAPSLDGLRAVWSHRGAPHLHPAADLPALAVACRPVSEADAGARLGWQRARLADIGMPVQEALDTVAAAVAAVLAGGPRVKGELSAEVTVRIPAVLSPWCGPCETHHVAEQLLRLAGLPGGAQLRPGTTPVVLEAIPDWTPVAGPGAPGPVVEAYLRLFAPGSPADVAGFVGTTVTALRPHLPDGWDRASVDGRAGLCPPGEAEAVAAAEPTGVVRLLPPSDPYLQGRDREVLLPEKAHRAAVWRPIGSPGVVAVDGEVTAVWRPRRKGKALELTVEPFRAHGRAERAAVEAEAERVREVRGAATVTVLGW